jgi:hypothetical protein
MNVYQVKEQRARRHALQDEMMHRLFSQIVSLMEVQYASLCRISLEYSVLSHKNDTDNVSTNKVRSKGTMKHDEEKQLERLQDQLGTLVFIYIFFCIYTCLYIHLYTYMYIHTYIYLYIDIQLFI